MNDLFLKAHRRAVRNAIDVAARTNTSLVISEGGKIKYIKPKYKYVRTPIRLPKKKS